MADDVATAFADHVVADPDRPESTRLVLLQLKFRRGGLATIEVDVDDNFAGVVSLESVYRPEGGTFEDGFRASVGKFKAIFG